MDRDLAEHLAKDTGLRPEEIDQGARRSSSNDTVQHLAEDTGLDEAEVSDGSAADPMDTMVARLPID